MGSKEVTPHARNDKRGSSPASRGGAGSYIEGQLGAFYLLALITGSEPRGLPGAKLEQVRFQGADQGYSLDDLILHARTMSGPCLLEIQSKREITFTSSDSQFKDVCIQIAQSNASSVPESQHFLAVATQRTSRKISGPYQDVLMWANRAETCTEFFSRLSAPGVANDDMRSFVEIFRKNLIVAGVHNEDDTIWRILRRFLILEFDFESVSPVAQALAVTQARNVLAEGGLPRAKAMWSNLIEISLDTAKIGGSINRNTIVTKLKERGFHLTGERSFASSRAKLEEMAHHTLADIGDTLAGVNLPRPDLITQADDALENHRIVEIRGDAGVGKSWVLKHMAERMSREAHIIVLDPVSTPKGGWLAFAHMLDMSSTAADFLNDLAASGGGTVFIDSLEMFTEPDQQRTVNDLLREVSKIPGFSVVVTTRSDFGSDGEKWLAEDALCKLGSSGKVEVPELLEAEIEILRAKVPQLRLLLDADHPAAPIARNPYRLSQLLKIADPKAIQTEATLAGHWWQTADSAKHDEIRPAQRILADLTECTLRGQDTLELRTDSAARSHLLESKTLRESRRDQVTYYHDVLRDWSVALFLHEDPERLCLQDLALHISPRIARGIELAGRLALECSTDCKVWLEFLKRLSPDGAHRSWRRQALLALVRSEVAPKLLERCSSELLADGGTLLRELCAVIQSLETASGSILVEGLEANSELTDVLKSIRVSKIQSTVWLLLWCIKHAAEIPLTAISSVLDLIQIHFVALTHVPTLSRVAELTAKMMFDWLMQLDIRKAERTIPMGNEANQLSYSAQGQLLEKLRIYTLALAQHTPEQAKTYLRAVKAAKDDRKVNAVRRNSGILARVAPVELADLISSSLIKAQNTRTRYRRLGDRAFTFVDGDYLPESPAQPPFLNLLETAPSVGLGLIRQLIHESVQFYMGEANSDANGFTLPLKRGTRFFPWAKTYLWSRGEAYEHSVGSALMALEAWGHLRLDAGESIETVLADVLGPDGSCAAYLLVAVDLLLSHWPKTRSALVPFLSCPELLAADLERQIHDQMGRALPLWKQEPLGKVKLAGLAARLSRKVTLRDALIHYIKNEPASRQLRAQLREAVSSLGAYDSEANFRDPAFIGAYALNVLNLENWVKIKEGLKYRSPPEEAAHLERLEAQSAQLHHLFSIEARINRAICDRAKGSASLAREAISHINSKRRDDSNSDTHETRSTCLIATAMLAARDGDNALLSEYDGWIRAAINNALSETVDNLSESNKSIEFNRPAMAICALVHLWCCKGLTKDRDRLINLSTRDDYAATLAFDTTLDLVTAKDPRVLKAAMRAAFTSCRWRWHPYDEDPGERARYKQEKTAADTAAVEAEIVWLNDGVEPEWPAFPEEWPRQRPRLRIPDARRVADAPSSWAPPSRQKSSIHVNSQAAARWLWLLIKADKAEFHWNEEIVTAYANWSANLNGYGCNAEVEIDGRQQEWNEAFYTLFATVLMDMPQQPFEDELARVISLPDQQFSRVAEIIIHTADAVYFNNSGRRAKRAIDLRQKIIERTTRLRSWKLQRGTHNLSIDYDTGGIVAKIFMNTHNTFSGTKSYLVPAVFDHIDLLLETLRPALSGGPVAFIAYCVMNMLMVAPSVRHIDFLLNAVEVWITQSQDDPAMWVELGIGKKVVDWLDQVSIHNPSLLESGYLYRHRIDSVIDQLVTFGLPEAHDFDRRIKRL